MKFFVHERQKGDAEMYSTVQEWAKAPEQSDLSAGFKQLIVNMFDRGGCEKHSSLLHGEFYVVDIPPFYWDGTLSGHR